MLRAAGCEPHETDLATARALTPLSLQKISLAHFRNYASLSLTVDARPVVLTGHNGAGKTNILEAISFLAPGRGMRSCTLAEVERQGAATQPWAVSAHILGRRGAAQIGTGRGEGEDASDKRLIKINGKKVRGQSALAQHLTVLWQTPQMDRLFIEGDGARRKFLDKLAGGFDPEHAGLAASYDYVMRERNRLLADPGMTGARDAAHWLSALERKMAEKSVAIAASRVLTIERLNMAMRDATGAFPRARLLLNGSVEKDLAAGISALAAEERLHELLARSRDDDAASGRARQGAHRTVVAITHVEKNMEAALCSTGEQKALLLSLILAQARAMAQWQEVVPVLLLDEVVAHLDESRRRALFAEIHAIGAQAWLTGTDGALFEALGKNAQYFTVNNGTVEGV